MRRVLVTGGAGFIGAHLVRALVGRGDKVRILDNLLTGTTGNISAALGVPQPDVEAAAAKAKGRIVPVAERCELLVGDIRDPEAAALACADAEVIFHLAALRSVPRSIEDPLSTHDVNATGTLRILEAARQAGAKRIVHASSSSVYGDTPLPKHEGQVPQPKSPYGASKLAGETYCQAYTRAFRLPTVSLRYFNVYGPWQDPFSEYAAVIPKFIRLALQGVPVPIHGDGLQTRDFTYVDDVVEANLAAAEAELASTVLNVGGGACANLLQLIRHLERILGRRIESIHTPLRLGDVRHSRADIRLAQRVIGYRPRIGFETGLRYTVEAARGD